MWVLNRDVEKEEQFVPRATQLSLTVLLCTGRQQGNVTCNRWASHHRHCRKNRYRTRQVPWTGSLLDTSKYLQKGTRKRTP